MQHAAARHDDDNEEKEDDDDDDDCYQRSTLMRKDLFVKVERKTRKQIQFMNAFVLSSQWNELSLKL